jgi:hypothetical protein
MQTLGLGHAGAVARRMIDDAVDTSGLERRENGSIHLVAVGLEPNGVVIEQHQKDRVEILHVGR